MHMDKAFPSKFLKASDADDGDIVVTIAAAKAELVGNPPELKLVLGFEETDKRFILNKTNAVTCQKLFQSPETDNWIGRRIGLFPTEVQYGAEVVMALRIRLKEPKVGTGTLPASDPVPS